MARVGDDVQDKALDAVFHCGGRPADRRMRSLRRALLALWQTKCEDMDDDLERER